MPPVNFHKVQVYIMLDISVICVGKLKERFYTDAAAEYTKRLGAYCKIAVIELSEAKRPSSPSDKDTAIAMEKEADAIIAAIPKGANIVAMCVEGRELSSPELAERLDAFAASGTSKLAFIIGGSDGLSDRVKSLAGLKLSMSRMTFPHHLARVMLLEQIYRALNISSGGKYHK